LFRYNALSEQTLDYTANGLNQYNTVKTSDITGTVLGTQTLGYDANASLTSDGVWTYSYDAVCAADVRSEARSVRLVW